MLSEATYKANYWHGEDWGNPRCIAMSARLCKTAPLLREYRELDRMWEDGEGDEQAIEWRMSEIRRELRRRGVEV